MVRKPAKKVTRHATPASTRAPSEARPLAVAESRPPALRRTLEKKHTINDIARLANVSKKTVSRVINESPFVREETRSRINEIIRTTGFTPDPQARGLAFRRSYLIGLVYDNPNAPY